MDAIAITLAGRGSHVGVAPLGTSLTEEQAAQLAAIGPAPVVATDADLAGRLAAERDFWMLAQHNLPPTVATFPEGTDPAELLARRGPRALTGALTGARPLGEVLIEERLANLTADAALDQAMRVLAAQPPCAWDPGARMIADRLKTCPARAGRSLHAHVWAWNRDPRKAAQARLAAVREVRARLERTAQQSPHERWLPLGRELDPRLPAQGDWPALAAMLHQGHRDGHDVAALARRLITEAPLGDQPAADLRYRLAASLPAPPPPPGTSVTRPPRGGAEHQRRAQPSQLRTPPARSR